MSFHGNPPVLNLGAFPETEREDINAIQFQLSQLGMRCEQAAAAVWLFQLSRSSGVPQFPGGTMGATFHWSFIAAKALASTIYQFDEDLENIGVITNKCPVFRTKIDAAARRDAIKALDAYFPGIKGIRHGTHHAAYGTPEKQRRHAPVSMGLFVSNLFDQTLVTDFEGARLSLDISGDSVNKLQDVTARYWLSFPK